MDAEEQKGGGHECELVKPLAKELQSECPVCLLVLRDPHVVSCCAKTFCEVCITRLKKAEKRCPTCNARDFTSEPDKKLKSALNKVQVRCGNQRGGCEWEGRLRDLEAHLNISPSDSDSKSTGCQFAGIQCKFCSGRYKRLSILEHESNNCPKRPYTCSECQLKGTYEAISTVHWFECQRNALNLKLKALQKSRSRSSWCSPWLLAFVVALCAMTLAALLSDREDKFSHLREKVKSLEDEFAQYRQTVVEMIASSETKLTQKCATETEASLNKHFETVNTKLEQYSATVTVLEIKLQQAVLEHGKNLEEERILRQRNYNSTMVIIEEMKGCCNLEEKLSQYTKEANDKVISLQGKIDQSYEQYRVQLETSLAGLKNELQNSIELLQQSLKSATTKLQEYLATITVLETKLQKSTTDCDRKVNEERKVREKGHNDIMVIIGEMKNHPPPHPPPHGPGGCRGKKRRRRR